jgi:glycosyltransferase involved in cell wall biosynthesis
MPPLGLCDAARAYAARCGALFVADVQDAWPETFERVLPRFVLSAMGLRRTARRIYAGSDGVSAVAERYVDLARGYGCRAPCAVFGHCIEGRARAAKTDDGVLHLAYIGNMSMSYDLETLVRVVAGMENVTLDIAGNGPDRARLEKLVASTAGAANVRMHPYLGETELARLLDSCDAGVIPMFPDSCVGVPGKMADYAAAGLRVVEWLGGETAAIVDRYAVGTHYAAGDTVSLGKAIAAVAKMGKNAGGEDFAGNFDASAVMARYVEWTMALSRGR